MNRCTQDTQHCLLTIFQPPSSSIHRIWTNLKLHSEKHWGGARPPSPPPLAAPLVSGHFVTAYPRNYTKQPVGQRLIMAHRANTKDTSHRTSSIIIMRSGGSCEDVESSVLSRQCRNTNCRNWKCYRGLVHVLLIKCCLMFREKGLGHSERNRFLSQLMKGLRLKR